MAAGPIDPVLADLMTALRLVAHDPAGLGGILLRGGDLIRDDLVAALAGLLPPGALVRRLPIGIDEDRLLGGIDLGETLASGRAVARRGLLAETDGGAIVVPMAERLGDMAAAHLAIGWALGESVGALLGPRAVEPYLWRTEVKPVSRRQVAEAADEPMAQSAASVLR